MGKDHGARAGVDEEGTVGDVTQQEQPDGSEQQGTCEHEEPRELRVSLRRTLSPGALSPVLLP